MPGDLSNTGIEPTSPVSPALKADSLGLSYQTHNVPYFPDNYAMHV